MDHRITYYDSYWYCYANSTAMLLSAGGETISPRVIEALSGVGLGAFVNRDGLPFFSGRAASPDKGVTQALTALGFAFSEKAKTTPESPPFDELIEDLYTSPAAVGPVDMRFLAYNSKRPTSSGVDHYIVVTKIEGDNVFVYDPAGFGRVLLTRSEFAAAWRAESIEYKRGYYRYWTAARRIASPSSAQIRDSAVRFYKSLYREGVEKATAAGNLIDEDAIGWLSDIVARNELSPDQRGHLLGFALPLGVKRALDFAEMFEASEPAFAGLKREQADLFGLCVTALAHDSYSGAAATLKHLAPMEAAIRNTIMNMK